MKIFKSIQIQPSDDGGFVLVLYEDNGVNKSAKKILLARSEEQLKAKLEMLLIDLRLSPSGEEPMPNPGRRER